MARKKISKDHRVKGGKETQALMKGSTDFTYKDAKRRAIVLGMPFPDVVSGDWNSLNGFINKSENKPDPTLIDKFDDWMDIQLELAGYPRGDPMRHYMLRLGYVGEDKEGEVKLKKVKGIPKPKKPKREKDDLGLWKGTKKSYTFELTARGYDLERIQRRVVQKFTDANHKSIQQWYRAAMRKIEKK